ncbi:hypothetical protein [Ralstonia solanacearum]|uniref:P-type ATPase n=1 Tax=Ralstonia solanacearum TaxID=305 RepID=UPI002E1A7424
MAAAIQEAQAQRAPTQRFVDQFASIYTPAMMLLALAVAVIGPQVTPDGWVAWTYRALELMVIACPWAVIISTMLSVVTGVATVKGRDIVVKGGVIVEIDRHMGAVALDKIDTVTDVNPEVNMEKMPDGTVPHPGVGGDRRRCGPAGGHGGGRPRWMGTPRMMIAVSDLQV